MEMEVEADGLLVFLAGGCAGLRFRLFGHRGQRSAVSGLFVPAFRLRPGQACRNQDF